MTPEIQIRAVIYIKYCLRLKKKYHDIKLNSMVKAHSISHSSHLNPTRSFTAVQIPSIPRICSMISIGELSVWRNCSRSFLICVFVFPWETVLTIIFLMMLTPHLQCKNMIDKFIFKIVFIEPIHRTFCKVPFKVSVKNHFVRADGRIDDRNIIRSAFCICHNEFLKYPVKLFSSCNAVCFDVVGVFVEPM